MPADDGIARREVTVGQVQVGVAQSRRGVLDEYLAGGAGGAVQVEFHDLERLSGLEQNSSLGLHEFS